MRRCQECGKELNLRITSSSWVKTYETMNCVYNDDPVWMLSKLCGDCQPLHTLKNMRGIDFS